MVCFKVNYIINNPLRMLHIPAQLIKFIYMVLAIGAFFSVSSCANYSGHNVKITVNLDVNGQLVSASGVQRLACREAIKFLRSMDSSDCKIRGEAIAIPIPQKGYLFMILDNEQIYIPRVNTPVPWSIIRDEHNNGIAWDMDYEKGSLLGSIPVFVVFDDIADPKTVKAVYFSEYGDGRFVDGKYVRFTNPSNYKEILGEGIELKSIHVEKTKDWVTYGKIKKALPWLIGRDSGMTMEGLHIQDVTLVSRLQTANFIRR